MTATFQHMIAESYRLVIPNYNCHPNIMMNEVDHKHTIHHNTSRPDHTLFRSGIALYI